MIKTMAFLAALGISNISMADEISLGVGASQFTSSNGIWYQEEFPHALKLTSPSIKLQYEKSLGNGLSINGGYLYLGKTSSEAEASASDADHSWPLSHWTGYGDVKGAYLQGKYTLGSGVYLQGGGLLYKATWHEYIPDWRPCAACDTQYVEVSHKPKWKLAPIYGIGYRYKSISIELMQTWVNGDEGAAEGNNFNALYTDSTTSVYLNYYY